MFTALFNYLPWVLDQGQSHSVESCPICHQIAFSIDSIMIISIKCPATWAWSIPLAMSNASRVELECNDKISPLSSYKHSGITSHTSTSRSSSISMPCSSSPHGAEDSHRQENNREGDDSESEFLDCCNQLHYYERSGKWPPGWGFTPLLHQVGHPEEVVELAGAERKELGMVSYWNTS